MWRRTNDMAPPFLYIHKQTGRMSGERKTACERGCFFTSACFKAKALSEGHSPDEVIALYEGLFHQEFQLS